jgi:hypothetical protein
MDSKLLPKEVPSLALEYNFIKPRIPLFRKNLYRKEIYGRLRPFLEILVRAIYVYHVLHPHELRRLDLTFFNCKSSDPKEAVRE